MNVKKIKFAICYLMVFIANATEYCQLIVYLTHVGYDATQRGIMFSCGAVGAILIQFMIGYLCDKHHTIKKYVQYTTIVFALSAYAVYHLDQYNYLLHILLCILANGTSRVVISTVDSWILESGKEFKDSYGVLRAFGSIGWVIGSSLATTVSIKWGYEGIAIACIIASLAVIGTNALIDDAQKQTDKKIDIKEVGVLFRNKSYLLLIVILLFIFLISAALDLPVVDKLTALNADEEKINLFWTITGICELPLFFIGQKMAKKIKESYILVIAIVAYIIRFVFYALAVTPEQILLATGLQALSYPLVQICSKTLIDKQIPDHLKSTGQQVANALYSSLATLISPLAAGMAEECFGINATFYLFAIVGAFALTLTLIYIRSEKTRAIKES